MKGLITLLAILVVVGLGFFLYSTPSAPPAEMTGAEVAQHEAEVRQELIDRTEEHKAYAMSGDVEGLMSLMTSDIWLLQPGMSVRRDDLRAVASEVFSTMTFTDIKSEFLEVFVHGDAAYVISEYSPTVQMEGQEPVTEISNCFTRWKKEDGVWKFDREVCGPRDAPPEG